MSKKILYAITVSLLLSIDTMAQLKAEDEILSLSNTIFKWEVENKIESLENVFDEKFVVISGHGSSQHKTE
jgi:hypothetical protein